jgi:ABC-type bacteriocin/lantibiotic exporter with double-glycine peptidase domain
MRGWGRRLRVAGQDVPVVRQRRGNDCGPAALATVAACHGVLVDVEALTAELALEQDGTDLLALSRAAARLGFRTRGVRVSYDAIPECTLPAIAHMRGGGAGHFVVLQRWSHDHVVVANPAVGVRRLSRKAFCRRATGYLLLVERVPD